MPSFVSNSPEETFSAGNAFASTISIGDAVGFNGELGAGKTQFIKGICSYFNVSESVTSPTFNLINEYSGNLSDKKIQVLHLDLYRIKDNKELKNIGLDNYNLNEYLTLIEWPKLLNEHMDIKNIYFNYGDCDNIRIINYS